MRKRRFAKKTHRWTAGSFLAAGAVIYGVAALLTSWCVIRTGSRMPTMEVWDGRPTIRFFDVGQGDCTLVTYGGHAVLFDTGSASQASAAAEFTASYAPVLDYLLITHPHEDHMGSAAEILERVDVKNLVMSVWAVREPFYAEAVNLAVQKGVRIIRVDEPCVLDAGKITVEILDSFGCKAENLNDTSLVSRVTCGRTTLLVAGDAEYAEEIYLTENSAGQLDCDYLKVGHHGSRTSTAPAFLAAVSPDVCVISAGTMNPYGHPSQEVTERIENSGAVLYRTDMDGTVVLRGEKEAGNRHFPWHP